MPLQRPEDLHRQFVEAFNAGDSDALVALFEPDAILVPAPGAQVTGHESIRAALAGFLALNGTMTLETRQVVASQDLALLQANWTLTGTAADGTAVDLGGRSSEVVRRQPDNTWLCAIDNPFADQ
jgi:uncharacterized protein (TIGR02246 family)